MTQKSFTVAIVGGGTAGITVAAQLARKMTPDEIVIIDPATHHYYQPLWTLVGGGIVSKEQSAREEKDLIPKGVHFIQEAVESFNLKKKTIKTDKNQEIAFQYLVVAPGLKLYWDQVKGLKEAIGQEGVVSNYAYDYVDYTWDAIRNFKGGRAIFTHPNTPVKCGGAPQKIMYLAEEFFEEVGVRNETEIIFNSANTAIFDVPKYRETLEKVLKEKKIKTNFKTNLIEIDHKVKKATFENIDTGEIQTYQYDIIHVTPPMGPHRFIKSSELADENGWVDVDPNTLQHRRFSFIFGLGDSANLPTSKTGAAIRKQAPTVVKNLLSLINGQPLNASYNGYTSCPIVTGRGKLILAEFDYNKEPKETFPFNQAKQRYSMYFLKKELLPRFYWHGMLKGRM
ncbi:NAD(P)/FAD-dependent oxidoreductase [Alkalihalobacterium chitinilyticum]|uniref:NAD(P)/FAD-dependent oxidoreductase n=1 Tax=Alkalihalobacterium chitinilyticum TaxID=2980103 RepID=A0ABT5VFE6_9BACI|nr:FAD/NAD(P)-binding oxidoreductase [Alkalihalobacterium chitinilyticum]MDE5413427.1 NAD(P)/FAD-dependent oxidoreductase [Alkalihalobacterium chitinilyticum]